MAEKSYLLQNFEKLWNNEFTYQILNRESKRNKNLKTMIKAIDL